MKIKDLKQQGKTALRHNYVKVLFVVFVILFLSVIILYTASTDLIGEVPDLLDDMQNAMIAGEILNKQTMAILLSVMIGFGILNLILRIVVRFLFENPVIAGTSRFMVRCLDSERNANVSYILYMFDHHYVGCIKAMFFRDLFTSLLSCVFVIPGIYKCYQWRLVPYLLPEHPELTTREVLALSREMMRGHKMEAFLLDLSFIPWHLLGIVTLLIVELFYVKPYKQLVNAAFYKYVSSLWEKGE